MKAVKKKFITKPKNHFIKIEPNKHVLKLLSTKSCTIHYAYNKQGKYKSINYNSTIDFCVIEIPSMLIQYDKQDNLISIYNSNYKKFTENYIDVHMEYLVQYNTSTGKFLVEIYFQEDTELTDLINTELTPEIIFQYSTTIPCMEYLLQAKELLLKFKSIQNLNSTNLYNIL